jgi:hydrogenase maturation factor
MRVDAVRPDAVAVCGANVEVMTDLVGAVEPGEILLVHAGVAIAKVEA